MPLATKQAINIKLAATVGHFYVTLTLQTFLWLSPVLLLKSTTHLTSEEFSDLLFCQNSGSIFRGPVAYGQSIGLVALTEQTCLFKL